jgi:hypothetical protein
VVILGTPLGTLWELEGKSLGICENTLRTWQEHKFKKKLCPHPHHLPPKGNEPSWVHVQLSNWLHANYYVLKLVVRIEVIPLPKIMGTYLFSFICCWNPIAICVG